MIVCSFYTDIWYARCAVRLAHSVGKYMPQVATHFSYIPDKGSWRTNVWGRLPFIESVMAIYPGKPVLWLDADAEVVATSWLLGTGELDNCDIAVVPGKGRDKFLGGTMYLNPTILTREWLTCWQRKDPKNYVLSQHAGAEAIEEVGPRINWLPQSYCAIFDWPETKRGDPIILQHQESRQARKREAGVV